MRNIQFVIPIFGALLLNACAFISVDENGDQHIIGFAVIDIEHNNTCGEVAGRSITVKNVGLLGLYEMNQKSIAFGLNSNEVVYLKHNTMVTVCK